LKRSERTGANTTIGPSLATRRFHPAQAIRRQLAIVTDASITALFFARCGFEVIAPAAVAVAVNESL